jgi:hypothetical protein
MTMNRRDYSMVQDVSTRTTRAGSRMEAWRSLFGSPGDSRISGSLVYRIYERQTTRLRSSSLRQRVEAQSRPERFLTRPRHRVTSGFATSNCRVTEAGNRQGDAPFNRIVGRNRGARYSATARTAHQTMAVAQDGSVPNAVLRQVGRSFEMVFMTSDPSKAMVLDVFLASPMRDRPWLRDRLRGAGITPGQLLGAKRKAQAAGLLRGIAPSREEFVQFFGEPLVSDDRHVTYELQLWPAHYYQLSLNNSGDVFHHGFVLKAADTALRERTRLDGKLIEQVFQVGFHTFTEVETILGSPAKTDGWGPMEDWSYDSSQGDEHLVFEFDLGLLTAMIRSAPSVVAGRFRRG